MKEMKQFRLNTALTDITTQEYAAEPELIADYIPTHIAKRVYRQGCE